MNKKSIIITIKKEIRSILRDKKTLITILLFPLLIPAMIFLYSYIYDEESNQEKYNIGVDYKINNNEKILMNDCYLKPIYYKGKKELNKAYKESKISGYIHYDLKKDKYVIYSNNDSEDGMYLSNYAINYLEAYKNYLAKIYLISEDIDLDKVYNTISYETKKLEGENFILNMIFSVSFTYIIMSIVLSTTNMATSATAVEKENGTLETLLTFPITAKELIIGKYLASAIIGIIASLIGLILTIVSILIANNSFELFKQITLSINPLTILIGSVICILSSLFISGLALAITSFAKTYKEAQSSSQVLSILTIIPMMISLLHIDINTTYYIIPIANYVQLLMDIFQNNYNYINIMIVLITTIIYVIIVISYIINKYKSEKVLFGE